MGELHINLLREFSSLRSGHMPRIRPYESDKQAEKQLYDHEGRPYYDVIIACERVGRAKDGCYYTMKGKNISHRISQVQFIDSLVV